MPSVAAAEARAGATSWVSALQAMAWSRLLSVAVDVRWRKKHFDAAIVVRILEFPVQMLESPCLPVDRLTVTRAVCDRSDWQRVNG
ncbi:hypothetical protein M2244_002016 [Rhodoferax antarcticus]|nr:hypothetical protein [Rhodoferax antarcticus]